MRNRLNISMTVLFSVLAAVLAIGFVSSTASSAQDRPLFRPGTAPVKAEAPEDTGATGTAGVTDHAAEPSASREAGSLASGSTRSFMSELLPTGLALGATLLVIVLARSAIKRLGGNLPGAKRPQGVVEVLARYPIARGQQVVLLKVGRRVIVAHQGGQGMQALSEFASESDVADILARCESGSRAASGFSFDALLRQSGKSLEQDESKATAARAPDRRASLPEFMRNAEIETVDLTRARRGGGR